MKRTYKDEQERWLDYRLRVLPGQLDRARRHYVGLCREAKRLNMLDLLTPEEQEM